MQQRSALEASSDEDIPHETTRLQHALPESGAASCGDAVKRPCTAGEESTAASAPFGDAARAPLGSPEPHPPAAVPSPTTTME
jgi:hypothetical protein